MEVSRALARKITVIPVLVDGARPVKSVDLPDGMKSLARRNALTISDQFNLDIKRLVPVLERLLEDARTQQMEQSQQIENQQRQRRAEIVKLLEEGQQALESEAWTKAKQRAQAVLILDPDNVKAQVLLANVEAGIKLAQELAEQKAQLEAKLQAKEKTEEEAPLEEPPEEKVRDSDQDQKPGTTPPPKPPSWKVPSLKGFKALPKWAFWVGGVAIIAVLIGVTLWLSDVYGWGTPDAPPEATSTPTLEIRVTATTGDLPTSTISPTPQAGDSQVNPIDGALYNFIPAGEFEMGDEAGYEREKHVHTVKLDAFWIGQTEVTNASYQLCVAAGRCTPPEGTNFDQDDYADHPVANVKWDHARSYCEWTGGRLPTEAEWERAARGGLEGQRYPWENNEGPVCTKGAANGAQYSGCLGDTVPAGSFSPNGYGLYDMAGNVREWVGDWYDEEYYQNSPSENPQGPDSGDHKVLRGGSWYNIEIDLRVAARGYYSPDLVEDYFGFRCAYDHSDNGSEPAEANILPEQTLEPAPSPVNSIKNPIDGVIYSYIPAGEFQMGSEEGDDDESPVHTVYLDAFWIGQTEITNVSYQLCVQAGKCDPPGGSDYDQGAYGDHPVVFVDWDDASSYCEWAGGRRPTEAEWERAARGGLESKNYPWGDDDPVCTLGAENGAQFGDCDRGTVPVRSFAPNGYGLFNMAGNVWEWVNSCYQNYPYDVNDGREDLDAGCNRVLRGGSFDGSQDNLRGANRISSPGGTYGDVGFRCAFTEQP
jgi:formylglycine-generating enzyme required for sulfatase activity